MPFLKGVLSTLFSFWMVCSNTQNRSVTVEWLDYWLQLDFWDLNQSLDKLDNRNANDMLALFEKHHKVIEKLRSIKKVAKTHIIMGRNIVMHLISINPGHNCCYDHTNSRSECCNNTLTSPIFFCSFEHKKSQAVTKLTKEKLLAYLEVSSVTKPFCLALAEKQIETVQWLLILTIIHEQ